jgi:hypothetical protein
LLRLSWVSIWFSTNCGLSAELPALIDLLR